MTLRQLADEYYQSAEQLAERIIELEKQCVGKKAVECNELRHRIATLRIVHGNTIRTAYDLAHYYERDDCR